MGLRKAWKLLALDCFQVPETMLAVFLLFLSFHELKFAIAIQIHPPTLLYIPSLLVHNCTLAMTLAYFATFFPSFFPPPQSLPPFPFLLLFLSSFLSLFVFLSFKKISLVSSHLYSSLILLLWLWLPWFLASYVFCWPAQIKEWSNVLLLYF